MKPLLSTGIITLLLIVTVTSNAVARTYQIEKIMGSWLGIPANVLISQLGSPDKTETLFGLDVIRYFHEVHPGKGCTRTFTIKDGKVERADSYGNLCPLWAIGTYKDWPYRPNYKKIKYDTKQVTHRRSGHYADSVR